jgi:hypothetical protein
MKEVTGTITTSGVEHSVTFGYVVFWTGEDYEVTVVDVEPPDDEHPEFINRMLTSNPEDAAPFCKGEITKYLSQIAGNAVTFEEELG